MISFALFTDSFGILKVIDFVYRWVDFMMLQRKTCVRSPPYPDYYSVI